MNPPSELLMDLYRSLADREAIIQANTETNGDRLSAALPELTEDDRRNLTAVHLDYFMQQDPVVVVAAYQMLISSLMVGIELGREVERKATSRV